MAVVIEAGKSDLSLALKAVVRLNATWDLIAIDRALHIGYR